MKKESYRAIVGYMCGVDWQHELGEASGGNRVYASLADLKHHCKCWDSCGVVKVSVEMVEWVVDQDIHKGAVEIPHHEKMVMVHGPEMAALYEELNSLFTAGEENLTSDQIERMRELGTTIDTYERVKWPDMTRKKTDGARKNPDV
jgi:hypothetical protein